MAEAEKPHVHLTGKEQEELRRMIDERVELKAAEILASNGIKLINKDSPRARLKAFGSIFLVAAAGGVVGGMFVNWRNGRKIKKELTVQVDEKAFDGQGRSSRLPGGTRSTATMVS